MPEPVQSLRVTFVLPSFARHPSGGYRVVFDYAAALQRRGHRCQVVVPILGCAGDHVPSTGPRERLKQVARYVAFHGRGPWQQVDASLQTRYPMVARPANLPAGDVVVATSWRTASLVGNAPAAAGARAYLIQHHEVWDSPDDPDAVDATWRLPLIKCVIARWLFDLAVSFGEGDRTFYTPNGLRLDTLRLTRPIEQRDGHTVGMLVGDQPWKGTEVGLRALELAWERLGGKLDVRLYGSYQPAFPLPEWMTFRTELGRDELIDYFNGLGIFVHPSLSEGWGLPASEAMAMGAALVSADNPAIFDFAQPDRDALVVSRGSAEALADAIVTLATDDARRTELARSAHDAIQRFSLERAVSRLEDVLLYAAGRGPRPVAMV